MDFILNLLKNEAVQTILATGLVYAIPQLWCYNTVFHICDKADLVLTRTLGEVWENIFERTLGVVLYGIADGFHIQDKVKKPK